MAPRTNNTNTSTPSDTGPLSGKLVHAHKNYDLRIVIFYPFVIALLLILVTGFAYQQLLKTDVYAEREKLQSHRRILFPAPRGNIYDRDGRLLVGNRPRYAISLNLDELRREFRREYFQEVRKNYREAYVKDDKDIPKSSDLWNIARGAVVQRYLDQVNDIIGREEKLEARAFARHFDQQFLLPYTLLNDLTAAEFSRLSERLPVTSPLQLVATSARHYPYANAAAHTLGYIRGNDNLDIEDFPGDELATFKMRGTIGTTGVEAAFNDHLQGKAGGVIYRVDPSGYRIEPPVERRVPVQGKNLALSLDIDLQTACENALGPSGTPDSLTGAVVAIDVRTGEILVLCSRPDYDLNDFSPRLGAETHKKILDAGAYLPRAIQGLYQPGSTFKLITSIAAFRDGKLDAADTTYHCAGRFRIGNRLFNCHDRHVHNDIAFHTALAKSCNIFYYQLGLATGPQPIADEARAQFIFRLRARAQFVFRLRGKNRIQRERQQQQRVY